jgi:hypothetical protein
MKSGIDPRLANKNLRLSFVPFGTIRIGFGERLEKRLINAGSEEQFCKMRKPDPGSFPNLASFQ